MIRRYVVLDGHHRVRICQELNIEPWTEIKKFESDLHERLFVVDSNLTRRHLNDYQRAKLALWAKPILQEIAKRNMSLGGQGLEISTTLNVRQEIATRAKVSDNTISKAELIIKYKDSISKEAHEISCKDKLQSLHKKVC